MTQAIQSSLNAAVAAARPRHAGGRLVLLACPESEQHALALTALELFLLQAGLSPVNLGAGLSAPVLAAAAKDARPAAVCLSATSPGALPALRHACRALAKLRSVLVFVGGPALAGVSPELAPATLLPARVDEAAAFVARTVQARFPQSGPSRSSNSRD